MFSYGSFNWVCERMRIVLLFGFDLWNKTGFYSYLALTVVLMRCSFVFSIFTVAVSGGYSHWFWFYTDKLGGLWIFGQELGPTLELDGSYSARQGLRLVSLYQLCKAGWEWIRILRLLFKRILERKLMVTCMVRGGHYQG